MSADIRDPAASESSGGEQFLQVHSDRVDSSFHSFSGLRKDHSIEGWFLVSTPAQ